MTEGISETAKAPEKLRTYLLTTIGSQKRSKKKLTIFWRLITVTVQLKNNIRDRVTVVLRRKFNTINAQLGKESKPK